MMMYYVCDALMSRGWIRQFVGGIPRMVCCTTGTLLSYVAEVILHYFIMYYVPVGNVPVATAPYHRMY
jgi:hypothetical protein